MTRQLSRRLLESANTGGGWSYRPAQAVSAEATALAAIALHGTGTTEGSVQTALEALTQMQRRNGAVPVLEGWKEPNWPTALAALAWTICDPTPNARHEPAARAVRWLLHTRGAPLQPQPGILGHDPTLIGWPWINGTHSWVEPTAYATLALKAAGQTKHPRTREAIRLLGDRTCADGGWNYGNTQTLGADLPSFPATTGIALTALANDPDAEPDSVRKAIDYLLKQLPRIRAPFTLSWAIIGLTAWNARPPDARAWLREAAATPPPGPPQPLADALLLIAATNAHLLIRPERENRD